MAPYRFFQTMVCLASLAYLGCANSAARSEVAALNGWSKDEVDALERPASHPNFVVSGETTAWIAAHKEKLKKLGYSVRWNSEEQIYVLTK